MEVKVSGKNSVPVAKDMYGLFFEDINYSLDGGLHAEMLENRNFEARFTYGKKDDYTSVYDGSYGWSVYKDNGAGSSIVMEAAEPLNEVNPHYMVFTGKGSNPAFTNKAYDGLYLKAGMKYRVSFYARIPEECEKVNVSVVFVSQDGNMQSSMILIEGNRWKKYELMIEAKLDIKQGDFVVSLAQEAIVHFDQFSMMPEDAVCGVFRKDLVEKLAALEPSFMRFPGGCIVEGNTLDNRYKWKDTIAPVEERKYNWNRWAVHNVNEEREWTGPYAHYGQTYGVGYYEYFLLCEHLNMKALPVMNVGLACQFMSTEKVELDSKEMQDYIQDALDLIEFANGPVDSKWGAKRAEMGHASPFGLEYLGVGNEQWNTDEVQFFKRYEMFEKAIHDKYPEMKLIGTTGPDVWGGGYFAAWEWVREAAKDKPDFVYAMDEHYYVAPQWLYEHVHFYDDYDRNVKVFAGEYACHIPGRAGRMNYPSANNLEAALAEAAFLTGVERNADVVVLASYAPLFARMGYTQWSPDLIWFDGEKSYETPSYWVQQLFSKYRGVRTLTADLGMDVETELKEKIYASAVEDESGKIILKLVNGSDEDKVLNMIGEGITFAKDADVVIMTGEKDDQNTIEERYKVQPVKKHITMKNGTIEVPKNSFMVLELAVACEE